jgi:hypothetical protein
MSYTQRTCTHAMGSCHIMRLLPLCIKHCLARVCQGFCITVSHTTCHIASDSFFMLVYWYLFTSSGNDNTGLPHCVIIHDLCP